MHKGVILLVKAKSRSDAQTKAEEFLEPYGDSKVWDWYQIGGRWSGTLTGYDPETDPKNIEQCTLCNGTGTRTDGMGGPRGCNGCGGKGKSVSWPTQWGTTEHDVMPAINPKVQKVIEDWGRNWKSKQLDELEKSRTHFAGNEAMKGYFLRKEADIVDDCFSFESNVYDTEEGTNNIPGSLRGYFAVMVDTHN